MISSGSPSTVIGWPMTSTPAEPALPVAMGEDDPLRRAGRAVGLGEEAPCAGATTPTQRQRAVGDHAAPARVRALPGP